MAMCTAITYKTKDFYFGRNMDYDMVYGEEVVVTPRKFSFRFRRAGEINSHYAIIGTACIVGGYPLYYDAVNEKGLCIAGLNFVGNAVFRDEKAGMDNIAQFELIPWILSRCASVDEAERVLKNLNLIKMQFNEKLSAAELHWLVADKHRTITVEPTADGMKIYNNSVGVLTNNPPFDEQMFQLNNYMHLSPLPPKNRFSDRINLRPYSLGMGAIGLPGDFSSQSRFTRAAFVKLNSVSGSSENESISQFFHILASVEQQRGSSVSDKGSYEITVYSSCCNADKGIYYYTTYENRRITAVDMHREDLNGCSLAHYPFTTGEDITYQN